MQMSPRYDHRKNGNLYMKLASFRVRYAKAATLTLAAGVPTQRASLHQQEHSFHPRGHSQEQFTE